MSARRCGGIGPGAVEELDDHPVMAGPSPQPAIIDELE